MHDSAMPHPMLVPMRVFFSFFSFRCSLSSPSDTGTVDPSRFIQSLVYGFFGIHVGPDEETVFISPSRDIPVATSVEVDAVTFNHHRIQVGLSPPEPSATHHHAPLPIHHPSTTHHLSPRRTSCRAPSSELPHSAHAPLPPIPRPPLHDATHCTPDVHAHHRMSRSTSATASSMSHGETCFPSRSSRVPIR